MNYAKYDPATGEIVQIGIAQVGTEFRYEPYIEGQADFAKHYVDIIALEIKEKTISPITVSGATLLNVPNGSKILTNGAIYPDCFGTVELEFTYSGVYDVVVKSPQNLDFIGTVTQP